MKAQDKHLHELFQQMLENPEQAMPHLGSPARSAKGVEDMTDLVDLADRLRERSAPVHNAEAALSPRQRSPFGFNGGIACSC